MRGLLSPNSCRLAGRAARVAAGFAVLAGVGLYPAATVAAAPSLPALTAVDLATGDTGVVTSSGAHVRASVYADSAGLGGPKPSYDVAVALSTPGYTETHTWTFPSTGTAFTWDAKADGTVVLPAADVAPFGVVDLTFSKTGSATRTTCGGSSYLLLQPVKVKGTLYFDPRTTGAAGWGTLGSQTKTFTSGSGSLLSSYYGTASSSCGADTQPPPCADSLISQAATSHAAVTDSSGGNGLGYLSGDRIVKLSEPSGATREDTANAIGKQVLSKLPGGGAQVTVTGTTRASGSAVLTQSAAGVKSSIPCGKDGSRQMTAVTWSGAELSNGTPRLALPERVFGRIVILPVTDAVIGSETTT